MTTNYQNTLITVAEDAPTDHAVVPDLSKQSVASQQYQMITDEPYVYTSDDVIFARVAERDGIAETDRATAKEQYFSMGRACLRTSPLAKQYGWGIHHDEEGKIALVAMESDAYAALVANDAVKKHRAMRRSRG